LTWAPPTPLANLADVFQRQGRFEEAEALSRQALALLDDSNPNDWRAFSTRSLVGQTLTGQKKYSDAEPLLLSGYTGMKLRETNISPENKIRIKEARERVLRFYLETGQLDRAAEWKQKESGLENLQLGADRSAIAQ
jgi:tetratricopeptide (TPR) repeat protein